VVEVGQHVTAAAVQSAGSIPGSSTSRAAAQRPFLLDDWPPATKFRHLVNQIGPARQTTTAAAIAVASSSTAAAEADRGPLRVS
jgi:hypothetical protein